MDLCIIIIFGERYFISFLFLLQAMSTCPTSTFVICVKLMFYASVGGAPEAYGSHHMVFVCVCVCVCLLHLFLCNS